LDLFVRIGTFQQAAAKNSKIFLPPSARRNLERRLQNIAHLSVFRKKSHHLSARGLVRLNAF
jgi:hypothetical protein